MLSGLPAGNEWRLALAWRCRWCNTTVHHRCGVQTRSLPHRLERAEDYHSGSKQSTGWCGGGQKGCLQKGAAHK